MILETERPPPTTPVPFLNQLVCGDNRLLLPLLPNACVDLVVTSPPYFQQRDYGHGGLGTENALQDYLQGLLEVFAECVRVLKPTGSIVLNLGDKYQDSSLLLVPYRFAIAASERCNVQLVNAITWLKTNPTPRQFKRRLVSSTEPFFHFVKTNDYQYFLDDFLADTKMPKSTVGDNIGQKYFGLIEQSNLTQAQKQMAREALSGIIQEVRSGEIEGFRMKIRGIHAEPFGGQEGGRKIQLDKNGFTLIRIYNNPLKKDALSFPVESLKNCPHPAIYPVKIIEEFLHLLTRKNDVVLDPFMGSGSSAVACVRQQRQFIGFEVNQDYCNFAQQRLDGLVSSEQANFWDDV
jgi:site-specific DNA-methyltransferase (adenine-specific)